MKWEVDWTSKYSLDNWIISLDLHCYDSYAIGMFGTLFFGGYLLSCAVFPPLADKYGRKIFIIISSVSQALALAVLLIYPNL